MQRVAGRVQEFERAARELEALAVRGDQHARWVERLGPFGEGNKEPLFLGRAFVRPGRVLQERHLRLHVLGNGRVIDCIGFGLAPIATEIPAGGAEMKLAFTPTLNRWRGQEQVQLKLKEIDFV